MSHEECFSQEVAQCQQVFDLREWPDLAGFSAFPIDPDSPDSGLLRSADVLPEIVTYHQYFVRAGIRKPESILEKTGMWFGESNVTGDKNVVKVTRQPARFQLQPLQIGCAICGQNQSYGAFEFVQNLDCLRKVLEQTSSDSDEIVGKALRQPVVVNTHILKRPRPGLKPVRRRPSTQPDKIFVLPGELAPQPLPGTDPHPAAIVNSATPRGGPEQQRRCDP